MFHNLSPEKALNDVEVANNYKLLLQVIEYGIFGEGSQILTNQKPENSAVSILIG